MAWAMPGCRDPLEEPAPDEPLLDAFEDEEAISKTRETKKKKKKSRANRPKTLARVRFGNNYV